MRLAVLLLLAVLLAASGWEFGRSPFGYAAQDRAFVTAGASAVHPVGTDDLGRDRAVRLSLALLLSLGGACAASALASITAVGLATYASLAPRTVRGVTLFAGDLALTLPWLFLLMLVRAALPLSLPPAESGAVTFLLLGALGVPAFLRVNYGKTSALARAGWMLQAHAQGLGPVQRARCMLPHLRPLLLAQFLLYVPACVAAEANLGALGLGLSDPLPSMGNFIASLQSAALLGGTWLVYLPILLLIVVLLGLELVVFQEKA